MLEKNSGTVLLYGGHSLLQGRQIHLGVVTNNSRSESETTLRRSLARFEPQISVEFCHDRRSVQNAYSQLPHIIEPA